jgi:hypothetical protein
VAVAMADSGDQKAPLDTYQKAIILGSSPHVLLLIESPVSIIFLLRLRRMLWLLPSNETCLKKNTIDPPVN